MSLRLYAFQNFYLAGIHAGIQTAHSIAELSVSVRDTELEYMYDEWANIHKTIIILNGGMQIDLLNTLNILEPIKDIIPFARFHEEQNALNGALTNVSCILPERYYECKNILKALSIQYGANIDTTSEIFIETTGWTYRPDELAFIEHLSRHRLMG